MDNQEFTRIYDHQICHPFTPKSPSPRAPINKNTYLQGHNDGWNAAVAFYKELGKI